MDLLHLLITFIAGGVAGSFGTLIGGGSLVTIPTLILLGLPPHTAIGTDRLGVTGMALAGWYKFHQKGMINYRIGLAMGIFSLVGAVLGASIVLRIDPAFLKKMIIGVTLSALLFVIAKGSLGIEKRDRPVQRLKYGLGVLFSFAVGMYGGFYGVMAGTFLVYILIFLFGQTFLESAATVKIPALTMTLTAGLVFAAHGAVDYSLTPALFLGCSLGSYLGAHYADRIGNVWIKRLFTLIVLIMVVKLLLP
jgi:uncharacterized membrane protein YfcA